MQDMMRCRPLWLCSSLLSDHLGVVPKGVLPLEAYLFNAEPIGSALGELLSHWLCLLLVLIPNIPLAEKLSDLVFGPCDHPFLAHAPPLPSA